MGIHAPGIAHRLGLFDNRLHSDRELDDAFHDLAIAVAPFGVIRLHGIDTLTLKVMTVQMLTYVESVPRLLDYKRNDRALTPAQAAESEKEIEKAIGRLEEADAYAAEHTRLSGVEHPNRVESYIFNGAKGAKIWFRNFAKNERDYLRETLGMTRKWGEAMETKEDWFESRRRVEQAEIGRFSATVFENCINPNTGRHQAFDGEVATFLGLLLHRDLDVKDVERYRRVFLRTQA